MRRVLVVVTALTVGVLSWATPGQAAAITYTTVSTASGTLGGTPFTNALVTVTLTGDTTGVEPSIFAPGWLQNIGTATLSVAGGGTATFNSPNGYAALLADFGGPVLGIIEFDNLARTSFTGITGTFGPSLAGYNLMGPLGPLTGPGIGIATQPDGTPVTYDTTAGALRLTSGNDLATLTVRVTAVPEPELLSLLLVGSIGSVAARLRRPR